MAKSITVQIENPPEGFLAVTSLEHARRYERKGRAVFIGALTIRFVDTAAQRRLCERATAERRARITAGEYDRVDRTFFTSARNLPLINADKMIREERSSRKWSFTAAVDRKLRPDHTADQVRKIREAKRA